MGKTSHRPSMSNVRTHTTRRTTSALARHELYMKLTALEIERSRRATEHDAMSKRLQQIGQRIVDIETEQKEIQQLLETGQTPSPKIRSKNGWMNFSY